MRAATTRLLLAANLLALAVLYLKANEPQSSTEVLTTRLKIVEGGVDVMAHLRSPTAHDNTALALDRLTQAVTRLEAERSRAPINSPEASPEQAPTPAVSAEQAATFAQAEQRVTSVLSSGRLTHDDAIAIRTLLPQLTASQLEDYQRLRQQMIVAVNLGQLRPPEGQHLMIP